MVNGEKGNFPFVFGVYLSGEENPRLLDRKSKLTGRSKLQKGEETFWGFSFQFLEFVKCICLVGADYAGS